MNLVTEIYTNSESTINSEFQEIERKFLVNGESFKNQAIKKVEIIQGYLNSTPERNVRVRTAGNQGFITIKGPSSDDGTTRFEWEKEISIEEAKALLRLCELAIIEKVRYYVKVGNHTFEVDEFFGVNESLILAEVELNTVDEEFEKPDWLGEEVTGNKKYYNARLSKQPYCVWGNAGLFSAQ